MRIHYYILGIAYTTAFSTHAIVDQEVLNHLGKGEYEAIIQIINERQVPADATNQFGTSLLALFCATGNAALVERWLNRLGDSSLADTKDAFGTFTLDYFFKSASAPKTHHLWQNPQTIQEYEKILSFLLKRGFSHYQDKNFEIFRNALNEIVATANEQEKQSLRKALDEIVDRLTIALIPENEMIAAEVSLLDRLFNRIVEDPTSSVDTAHTNLAAALHYLELLSNALAKNFKNNNPELKKKFLDKLHTLITQNPEAELRYTILSIKDLLFRYGIITTEEAALLSPPQPIKVSAQLSPERDLKRPIAQRSPTGAQIEPSAPKRTLSFSSREGMNGFRSVHLSAPSAAAAASAADEETRRLHEAARAAIAAATVLFPSE